MRHFQIISSPFRSPLSNENISYTIFKIFLGFLYSLNLFKFNQMFS